MRKIHLVWRMQCNIFFQMSSNYNWHIHYPHLALCLAAPALSLMPHSMQWRLIWRLMWGPSLIPPPMPIVFVASDAEISTFRCPTHKFHQSEGFIPYDGPMRGCDIFSPWFSPWGSDMLLLDDWRNSHCLCSDWSKPCIKCLSLAIIFKSILWWDWSFRHQLLSLTLMAPYTSTPGPGGRDTFLWTKIFIWVLTFTMFNM